MSDVLEVLNPATEETVATRYDRPAVRYEATVLVAAINESLWPALSQQALDLVAA
ncbi:hypothetical protein [Streptomyces sp. NPDC058612]|uniref:hypothetical protein n=1 Tax=Streptomyces sp. NPDC058612 TaxID=3346555 RepID=UPI00365DC59D